MHHQSSSTLFILKSCNMLKQYLSGVQVKWFGAASKSQRTFNRQSNHQPMYHVDIGSYNETEVPELNNNSKPIADSLCAGRSYVVFVVVVAVDLTIYKFNCGVSARAHYKKKNHKPSTFYEVAFNIAQLHVGIRDKWGLWNWGIDKHTRTLQTENVNQQHFICSSTNHTYLLLADWH